MEKGLWYKDDELMRTVFNELLRWNEIAIWLIPLLKNI